MARSIADTVTRRALVAVAAGGTVSDVVGAVGVGLQDLAFVVDALGGKPVSTSTG